MRNLFFAAVLLVVGSAVYAQGTPDGETPAQESVCDTLDGRAWGLCNAFCEAMDCDSNDPNANREACDKVKGKFVSLGLGDLPCEPILCPCGAAAEWIGLFTVGLPEPEQIRCEENEGGYDPSLFIVEGPNTYGVPRFGTLHGFHQGTGIRCVVFDQYGVELSVSNELTEEEYEACRAEVQSVADQLGLTCLVYHD